MNRAALAPLITVAACGDGWTTPDARIAADAPRGLVSVRVLANALGAAEQRVFFQNSDSSVVLATRTDATGRANAFMAPGGFLTVAADLDGGSELFTLAEVVPGEEYTLDLRTMLDEATRAIYVDIPLDPQSTTHRLYSTCGIADISGADLEPTLALLGGGCSERADLLVFPTLDNGRYLFLDEAPIYANARVSFHGEFRATIQTRISVQHVPYGTDAVFATQRLIGQGRNLYPLDDFGSNAYMRLTDGAGSGLVGLAMPGPSDGTMMTWLDAQEVRTAGAQHVIAWDPPLEHVTIDFAELAQRPYLAWPTYLAEANRIGWIEGSAGRVPDAMLVTLTWFDLTTGRTRTWSVFAPRHEEASLRLPVLPDPSLQPIRPSIRELTSVSIDGGVERLHRLGLHGRWRPQRNEPWAVDTPSGRLVYQVLRNGPLEIPDDPI